MTGTSMCLAHMQAGDGEAKSTSRSSCSGPCAQNRPSHACCSTHDNSLG